MEEASTSTANNLLDLLCNNNSVKTNVDEQKQNTSSRLVIRANHAYINSQVVDEAIQPASQPQPPSLEQFHSLDKPEFKTASGCSRRAKGFAVQNETCDLNGAGCSRSSNLAAWPSTLPGCNNCLRAYQMDTTPFRSHSELRTCVLPDVVDINLNPVERTSQTLGNNFTISNSASGNTRSPNIANRAEGLGDHHVYPEVIRLDNPRPCILRNANEYIDPNKHFQLRRNQFQSCEQDHRTFRQLNQAGANSGSMYRKGESCKSSQQRSRTRELSNQKDPGQKARQIGSNAQNRMACSIDSQPEVHRSRPFSHTGRGQKLVQIGSAGNKASVITSQPNYVQDANGSPFAFLRSRDVNMSSKAKPIACDRLSNFIELDLPLKDRERKVPPKTSEVVAPNRCKPALSSAADGRLCHDCGKCRCAGCSVPRRLPSCWLCGNRCLLSVESCIDLVSCMCCVRACCYHLGLDNDFPESPDLATDEDRTCSCAKPGLLKLCGYIVAAALLPCLWCYIPLTMCSHCCNWCYSRCMTEGCQCGRNGGRRSAGWKCDGGLSAGVRMSPPSMAALDGKTSRSAATAELEHRRKHFVVAKQSAYNSQAHSAIISGSSFCDTVKDVR